jgi:hypothetical protein
VEDGHDPIANYTKALNSALLCEETYGSGDVGETWGFMSFLNEEAYGNNDLPVGGGKPRFLAINLANSPTRLPAPGPSTVEDTSVEDSLRAWPNFEDGLRHLSEDFEDNLRHLSEDREVAYGSRPSSEDTEVVDGLRHLSEDLEDNLRRCSEDLENNFMHFSVNLGATRGSRLPFEDVEFVDYTWLEFADYTWLDEVVDNGITVFPSQGRLSSAFRGAVESGMLRSSATNP